MICSWLEAAGPARRMEPVRPQRLGPCAGAAGERVLPLQPRVLAELQTYGLPRRGPVFTMYDNLGRRTSRPITAARVSAACGTYLAEAGTGATLHALRHFFATALYQTSQDLRLVQEALGHSSPNITAIYAAFDTSKTAGAMAQVAASIEDVPCAVRR